MESESTTPLIGSEFKIRPFMNLRELLDLANLVTLAGLAAAIACTLLAIRGHLALAAVALMVSGVCDLFDGFVARRLNRSQQQHSSEVAWIRSSMVVRSALLLWC